MPLATAICLSTGMPALTEELQDLFVPIVSVVYDQRTLPDGTGTASAWSSSLHFFNNSAAPATFTQTAVYGQGAVPSHEPVCESSVTLAPQTGRGFGGCFAPFPDRGVGFLALQTSPGIVVRADVIRSRFRCECEGPGCTTIPQGQVRMPTYRSLFPAGISAVSGPIELGNLTLSPNCASENQQYRRRVNVTLFNAGDAVATFTLTVRPVQFSSTPISELSVVVPAKDVIQVNRIAVPTEPTNDLRTSGGYRIWITITADQPFLSYVSTVFDNPEPGAEPFDVYPSYLEN